MSNSLTFSRQIGTGGKWAVTSTGTSGYRSTGHERTFRKPRPALYVRPPLTKLDPGAYIAAEKKHDMAWAPRRLPRTYPVLVAGCVRQFCSTSRLTAAPIDSKQLWLTQPGVELPQSMAPYTISGFAALPLSAAGAASYRVCSARRKLSNNVAYPGTCSTSDRPSPPSAISVVRFGVLRTVVLPELVELIIIEPHVEGGDGVGQLFWSSDPHDGGCHCRLGQQPGESDLRPGDTMLGGHGSDDVHDPGARILVLPIKAVGERIGLAACSGRFG